MKLEDIQSAVKHAATAEFKRAYYNLCAVLPEQEVIKICDGLYKEVYFGAEADEA